MDNKRYSYRLLPKLPSIFIFILTLTCMFILSPSPSIALDPKISLPGSDEEVEELHSSGVTNINSTSSSTITTPNLQTYIVHVKLPYGYGKAANNNTNSLSFQELETFYYSFLPPTIGYSQRQTRMVHCYRHAITGFAARLTPEEAKSMEKKDGFVSAAPDKIISLLTTHTPNFMGLQQNIGFWLNSNYGRGIIIGVVDSGVTPFHPSFSGDGLPAPPAKWRGRCDLPDITACNNKLIGARTFVTGSTPVDIDGHGTHVASTAVGNYVSGANVFGQARGTASGIAPLAHLASYKVCQGGNCNGADMLAGIDAAIGDGIDVLSISAGFPNSPFDSDVMAIGAFSAIRRGIFVSYAAGNFGPEPSTLRNQAPWILTVGAGTTNRNITATAVLGNGVQINGQSLNQPNNFPPTLLPLVYRGRTGNPQSSWCLPGSFDNVNVRGMVVLCDYGGVGDIGFVQKGQNVLAAGGAAMILVNDQRNGDSIPTEDAHVLPTTHVGYRDGTIIKSYIWTTFNPQATIIFRGTVIGVDYAPEVASFSSRGPNTISPGILKPDIIGPGRNILAAWPFSVDGTTTRATFNIISGTSMACPHLSGTVALLKNTHPTWSPAAIKSAIMTTASVLNGNGIPITDQTKQEADWYAIGAGQVIPSRANDPGLVYDISPDDYISYLCGLGYTNNQVTTIVQSPVSCPTPAIPEAQLNYPTFSIAIAVFPETYSRTVTNVGNAISSYTVSVNLPSSVNAVVTPTRLDFTSVNQQLTYRVTFSRTVNTGPMVVRGYLTWTSTTHVVRSQIVVRLT